MTLPSNNHDWGFYGSIRHHAEPEQAWPLAMTAIMTATSFSDEAVRDFLDSKYGRIFADDVANALVDGHELNGAVEAAVERWMRWETDSYMQAQSGIPVGLPYLVGLVGDGEIRGGERLS
jgi:hypothetical protein